MKMYSRILLQTCFNNLYNLAISALVQPIYILEGDRSIIFHNGMLRTSPPSIQHITYLAWFLGFYFSALFLPVQFIYRYLVLCKEYQVSNALFAFMLSIAGLIAILEIYLATEGGYPSPPYDSLIHTSASYQVFKESNQQDVMLSLNAKMSNPFIVTAVFAMLVTNVLCYTIIWWCSLRIWTFLKNVSANSKVKEINRQLTISLVVQALLPAFVFCILIFCLVVLLIVVDTNLFTMTYLAAPLNWMAVLSPLLTIIIIRPYRNFVLCRQGMKWNMSETYRARRKTLVSVARRMSFGITNSGVVC